jgi:hypothetical protein
VKELRCTRLVSQKPDDMMHLALVFVVVWCNLCVSLAVRAHRKALGVAPSYKRVTPALLNSR